MDSYLEVAHKVLKQARQPLSSRQILEIAYRNGIVPHHLYGKTQHKTLQARLSEDILKLKEQSQFFRTKPGVFFLREFLQDTSIPRKHRQPIAARRRKREIYNAPSLVFDRAVIERAFGESTVLPASWLEPTLVKDSYGFVEPKYVSDHQLLAWSAGVMVKEFKVLSYRIGRYRDDRDCIEQRRSVTFSSLIHPQDITLFATDKFGFRDSAVEAVSIDLDIPITNGRERNALNNELLFYIRELDARAHPSLIAVIIIDCPDWFEPTSRRLSLNNPQWIDMRSIPNDVDDFDPWSQVLLEKLRVTANERE